MKQFILFITFLVGIGQSEAQYRNSGNRNRGTNFAIKNNVLGYLINTYNFSVEYQIASKQSVQLVVKIFDRDDEISNKLGTGYADLKPSKGFSIGSEYRLYIEHDKDDLRGVYFSPYLRYFYEKRSIEPGYYTISGYGPVGSAYFKRDIFSGGVMLGAQDLGKNSGLGIDCFIGVGYRKKMDRDFSGDMTLYKKEDNKELMSFIEIRFGFNILISNA